MGQPSCSGSQEPFRKPYGKEYLWKVPCDLQVLAWVMSLECLSDPQAQWLTNQQKENKGEAISTQSSQANESSPVSQSKRNVSVCLHSYPEGSRSLWHTKQRCGLFPSWTPRWCQVTPSTGPASPDSRLGKTEHSLHRKLAMLVEPIYTLL